MKGKSVWNERDKKKYEGWTQTIRTPFLHQTIRTPFLHQTTRTPFLHQTTRTFEILTSRKLSNQTQPDLVYPCA